MVKKYKFNKRSYKDKENFDNSNRGHFKHGHKHKRKFGHKQHENTNFRHFRDKPHKSKWYCIFH